MYREMLAELADRHLDADAQAIADRAVSIQRAMPGIRPSLSDQEWMEAITVSHGIEYRCRLRGRRVTIADLRRAGVPDTVLACVISLHREPWQTKLGFYGQVDGALDAA